MFSVIEEKFENGMAYCDFTLSNFVVKRRQNNIPELVQNAVYRPLIAIGNLDSSSNLTFFNIFLFEEEFLLNINRYFTKACTRFTCTTPTRCLT